MESSIGRGRRARFWDDQDSDLEDGALNKVEGETDMRHRDKSFRIDDRGRISSHEPGRGSHMLGNECCKNKFHIEQPTTSLPNRTRTQRKGRPTSYTSAGSTGTWRAQNSRLIYAQRGDNSALKFAKQLEVMHHTKPMPTSAKECFSPHASQHR